MSRGPSADQVPWPRRLIDASAGCFQALNPGVSVAAPCGKGARPCTTVSILNLPTECTEQGLMEELDSRGFGDCYDFIYTPLDRKKKTIRGFCFVNFLNPQLASSFQQMYSGACEICGYHVEKKAIAVLPADIQGFDQNALHFISWCMQRGKEFAVEGPLFLRPLPPHLAAAAQGLQLRTVPHHDAARRVQQQQQQQRRVNEGLALAAPAVQRIYRQQV
mmetsp:Transcript_23208/g.53399  ORF Transcript_23208/g.53399 Transcript_23208/m.53399 type:complete len:219 (+) Transcript_23208:132-788(+)